jgi:hypothetical protein
MIPRCAALLPVLLLWSAPAFAEDPPEATTIPTPAAKPTPSSAPTSRAAPATSATELNTPMTVGLTLFTLSYLPCVVTGAIADDGDVLPLVLPAVGPWITGHLVKPEDWGWVFLGSLSGLQVIGAGIFAFGALLPRDPSAKRSGQRSPSLTATPVVGPRAWGLSVQGAF